MKAHLLTSRAIVIDLLLLESFVSEFWKITVEAVHFLFILIVMVESEPENDRGGEGKGRDTGIHPQNLGIDEDRDESLVEGGAEGVGEEVHALHEGLHAGRGLGVGVFETGDGNEDF